MTRPQAESSSADGDLPDIVDLVMEMGRTGDASQAGPPSPSPLPVAAARSGPNLPGHLEKLADRARDYVEAASSANTRRAA